MNAETPRTWTLYRGTNKSGIIDGPGLRSNEQVKVIEKAPILAVIENLLAILGGAGELEECDCAIGDAKDLLREHGRSVA